MRALVLTGSLVRVKIWAHNGTIVYSDEERLIGDRFALDQQALAALHGGEARAELSDLSAPENRYDPGVDDRLLEVYVPAATVEGTPLIFEAYFRYSGAAETGEALWRRFAPIGIGSMILVEMVQVPLGWRLARRLRTTQRHRERLLRSAATATVVERRRIAGELHDGAVQELAGLAMRLAAVDRASPGGSTLLRESSDQIRSSVDAIRALIVDIYPPDLSTPDALGRAIHAALARAEATGLRTRLEFHLGGVDPGEDCAAIIYRSVQETLRNVAAHAMATDVRVVVREHQDSLVLVVEDDGQGFSADLVPPPSDGHIGLRHLTDMIGDAGGSIQIASEIGVGTRITIVVPRHPARSRGSR